MTFKGEPNEPLAVEWNSEATSLGWQPLATRTTEAPGNLEVIDPAPVAAQRFYRCDPSVRALRGKTAAARRAVDVGPGMRRPRSETDAAPEVSKRWNLSVDSSEDSNFPASPHKLYAESASTEIGWSRKGNGSAGDSIEVPAVK